MRQDWASNVFLAGLAILFGTLAVLLVLGVVHQMTAAK